MQKILIPVDGSEPSLHAVEHVVQMIRNGTAAELHLLNVQTPMPVGVHAYLSAEKIQALEQQEAEHAMRRARAVLDGAQIPFVASFRAGAAGQEIAEYAREAGCDTIVMGTRGMGNVGNLVAGSVAGKVVQLAHVPVTLVK